MHLNIVSQVCSSCEDLVIRNIMVILEFNLDNWCTNYSLFYLNRCLHESLWVSLHVLEAAGVDCTLNSCMCATLLEWWATANWPSVSGCYIGSSCATDACASRLLKERLGRSMTL